MYAILGLSLVTVSYGSAFVTDITSKLLPTGFEGSTISSTGTMTVESINVLAETVIQNQLRDDITLWALFYVAAFIKIFIECRVYKIIQGNYLGIQLWHLLVPGVLLASVATPPLGPLLTAIRGLYS